MRIWYQSGLSFQRFPTYERFLREHLNSADPGTTVYVNGTSRGGTGVEYRFTEYFFAREMIENGLKAEQQGFDAYVIGTTNEAGLTECREVLNIPVIGMIEASVHVACVMGRNFALIAPNEKMIPHFEEQIARYGLKERLAGIQYMSFATRTWARSSMTSHSPGSSKLNSRKREQVDSRGCRSHSAHWRHRWPFFQRGQDCTKSTECLLLTPSASHSRRQR